MKKFLKKWQQTILHSMKRLELGAHSAQLTFYLLMSLVPIVLVIGNLIPLLPISYDKFMDYLAPILPENLQPMIEQMITSYLNSYNGNSIFLGSLIALWSSSQALNVMQHVFNTIYHTTPRKNKILARLLSFFMSILLILLIIGVGLVLAYGSSILRLLQEIALIREGIDVIFNHFKWLVALVVLVSGLSAIYYIMPNVKRKLRYVIPGAIFASLGILVVSQMYSTYVSIATTSALTDGTLGVFVMLMLWLYAMSMVILLGAWVNVLCYDYRHSTLKNDDEISLKNMARVYCLKELKKGQEKDNEK